MLGSKRGRRPGPTTERKEIMGRTLAKPSMRDLRAPLAFLAPSLLGLTAFFLAPFAEALRRSFTNAAGDRFVGLDNYSAVLTNEAFALAAGNTARFMLTCVPLLLVLSLAFALFLRTRTPFRRAVKTSLLVPLAVPAFTAALLMSVTFDVDGIADGVLTRLGMQPVSWLHADAAFWVLVGNYLWRNLGYCVVLWLAALSCIPERLLEAARIDGASGWQTMRRVTLPLLMPSIPIVAILSVANAFKVYREAYLVAGSYPPESMYLLPHLFNDWFASLSMGKLAAGGALLGVALLAVACLLFRAWGRNGNGR